MLASKKLKIKALAAVVSMTSTFAFAAEPVDPTNPSLLPAPGEGPNNTVSITQEEIASGDFPLDIISQQGMQMFSTPFNTYDGLGDGPLNQATKATFGGRPSYVQPNDDLPFPFPRRANGGDSQSCLECHAVGSAAVIPTRFTVGGVGGVSNHVLATTNFDIADEAGNGFARVDGRPINPPFVFGSGGLELVAMEMTKDLQKIKKRAKNNPGVFFDLKTHGVSFGKIRWEEHAATPEAVAIVEEQRDLRYAHACNPEGTSLAIGDPIFGEPHNIPDQWADTEDGTVLHLDVSQVEGVGPDLIIRPFGRKATRVTTREFDCDAMHFHHGIEAEEVFGEEDHDGDGYINEITIGQMSALAIFNTTTPPPFEMELSKEAKRGKTLFKDIGCVDCHKPKLQSKDKILSYHFPEFMPGLEIFTPETKFYEVDMTTLGFVENNRGGITVPAFSDLKVHYMGPRLEEKASGASDTANGSFITARLWGVADTAPYLHDGRAPTLHEAILQHDGEAFTQRESFRGLTNEDQAKVIAFLKSLRTPEEI
ncbi:di-heme oxidoredictase family protein [Sessilibacter sp. MAH4]